MPVPEITNEQREIIHYVKEALRQFNQKESYLISRDLSERCICARFAMYLQHVLYESQFHEYVVDVEYNRGSKGNEYAAKVLIVLNEMHRKKQQRPSTRKTEKIVVDLIAHKRGYDLETGFDNLLCIEMKKAYKNLDMSSDLFRLECLTNPLYDFGYKAGFMIVAVQDKDTDTYCLKIHRTYCNGMSTD